MISGNRNGVQKKTVFQEAAKWAFGSLFSKDCFLGAKPSLEITYFTHSLTQSSPKSLELSDKTCYRFLSFFQLSFNFPRTFLQLSFNFLSIFFQLSFNFLSAFLRLSFDFPSTFFQLSFNFLSTFLQLSFNFPRTFLQL